MKDITVIKIGGTAISGQDTTPADIAEVQRRGLPLVVVHGGANRLNEWLQRQGTPTKFVRGERITDAATLEMVAAVLGGLVNKEITARINALGGRAVGITGVDGALLQAAPREAEMGFVGEIEKVDTTVLTVLLAAGLVPVVGNLGQRLSGGPPHMLNINGDITAGEIAAALGAKKLVFMTDVAGVRDAAGTPVSRLTPHQANELVSAGQAVGGMIPKLRACLRAVAGGAEARIIDGTVSHALLREIDGKYPGTTITAVTDGE